MYSWKRYTYAWRVEQVGVRHMYAYVCYVEQPGELLKKDMHMFDMQNKSVYGWKKYAYV